MTVHLGIYTFVWNRSHTWNVYVPAFGMEDCFTFGFEKNKPTQLEAMDCLLNWITDNDLAFTQ